MFDRYFEDRLMGGGCLVTIERSSGLIVGASEFSAFSSDERQVEIGATFLARRCWGGAYNGEVKRLMIDHAFASVDSVVFSVSEANRRSQAALVKIGATVDRRFMRHGTGYLGFRIRKCAWLEGEIPRR